VALVKDSMKNTRLCFTLHAAAAVLVAVAAGCSAPTPGAIDYQTTTKPPRAKEALLAVPPDLTKIAPDQRFEPPSGGQASLSTYQRVEQTAPPVETAPAVLPAARGMRIERDGSQRWLVVNDAAPDTLWPRIRQFWLAQGFVLVVDAKNRGVMETDWRESRAKLDLGLVRNTLSKAMDNSYVAAERNRFRTRLEQAPGGGTYVFLTQQGMHEVLTGTLNESTRWADKPNDPALEAEYLSRLMLALQGKGDEKTVSAMAPAAATPPVATPAAPGAAAAVAASDVSTAKEGGNELVLAESYDRAWLRVGLALDRTNFTVDDRDRTHGLYYIRYVDPNDRSSAEQGFWSQVFHGRKEKVAEQYRINVRAVTENRTRIAVVDEAGKLQSSRQATQIIDLLEAQLH
jgi:outer membrane protein assembly factor BamC